MAKVSERKVVIDTGYKNVPTEKRADVVYVNKQKAHKAMRYALKRRSIKRKNLEKQRVTWYDPRSIARWIKR